MMTVRKLLDFNTDQKINDKINIIRQKLEKFYLSDCVITLSVAPFPKEYFFGLQTKYGNKTVYTMLKFNMEVITETIYNFFPISYVHTLELIDEIKLKNGDIQEFLMRPFLITYKNHPWIEQLLINRKPPELAAYRQLEKLYNSPQWINQT